MNWYKRGSSSLSDVPSIVKLLPGTERIAPSGARRCACCSLPAVWKRPAFAARSMAGAVFYCDACKDQAPKMEVQHYVQPRDPALVGHSPTTRTRYSFVRTASGGS